MLVMRFYNYTLNMINYGMHFKLELKLVFRRIIGIIEHNDVRSNDSFALIK